MQSAAAASALLQPLGAKGQAGQPNIEGIDFTAGLKNGDQGFNYSWLQTIDDTSTVGSEQPIHKIGRDVGYPYKFQTKVDSISADDSPLATIRLGSQKVGDELTRPFTAAMWLLATPTEGGIAVPFMAGTWHFTYTLKWEQTASDPNKPPVPHTPGLPKFYYHFVSATPPGDIVTKAFATTVLLPNWFVTV